MTMPNFKLCNSESLIVDLNSCFSLDVVRQSFRRQREREGERTIKSNYGRI